MMLYQLLRLCSVVFVTVILVSGTFIRAAILASF